MVSNLPELIPALQAAKKYQAQPEASTLAQRRSWLHELAAHWGSISNEELSTLSEDSALSESLVSEWDLVGSRAWLQKFILQNEVLPASEVRLTARGVLSLLQPQAHGLRLLLERLAPALLAGNSVLIKMSSKTPTASLLVERWLNAAGIPKEVAVVVAGASTDYGNFLVSHPAIRGVSAIGRPEVIAALQKEATGLGRAFQGWTGGRSTLLQLDILDQQGWTEVLQRSVVESAGTRPYDLLRVFVLEKDEALQFEALKAAMAAMPAVSVSARTAQLFGVVLQRMKDEEGKHNVGGAITTGVSVTAGDNHTQIQPAMISHLAQCSEDQQLQAPVPVLLFATVKYAFDVAKWVNNASQGFAMRINGPQERIDKLKEKFEVGYLAANRDFDPAESLLFGVKESAVGNTDLRPEGSFFAQSLRYAF